MSDLIDPIHKDHTMQEDRICLPIKKLDSTVELPHYAYAYDAGLDISANEDVILQPFERYLVSTGLALAIPEGYAGFVLPRSGRASKEGLSLPNTPGLIDAHYRGELKISTINLDPTTPIHIKKGERIAQLVIQKVALVSIVEVDELGETDRAAEGFGSSGR